MTAAPLRAVDYQRPVPAILIVRLSNGDEWPATADDLDRFRLVDRGEAYMAFDTALTDVLVSHCLLDGGDITDAALNPLRYLVETAVANPGLIHHDSHEGWRSVADLERRLQQVDPTRLRELAGQLTDLGRRLDEAEHANGSALGMGQVLAAAGRELAAMVGGPA